jgi:ribonuclease HI
MLAWKKPDLHVFKLNIDGTRSGVSGKIGAGGVLRNHRGDWIAGFQVNLGIGGILEAEAWGLFHGLKLAQIHNILKLEIESDSAVLVNLVQGNSTELHPLGSLLSDCRKIMDTCDEVSISHIFRECNMTADALAKNSIENDFGILLTFDSPPAHAIHAYLADFYEISRPRKVRAGQFG